MYHRAALMFQTEEGKAMLRAWGLDESLRGVCSIALGYTDGKVSAPSARKADYYRIIR